MARLYLLRHAKSDWSQHGLSDHERPLNKRGRRAAAEIGRFAALENIQPGLVLCSTAVRAKETLSRVMEAGKLDWPVQFDPALYGAGVQSIVQIAIREAGDRESVLLVGHNPGFHDTALALAADGDPAMLEQMRWKYPTGTLSAIDLSCPRIGDIGGEQGTLTLFCRPKDLD